jgi:hypothetical protein
MDKFYELTKNYIVQFFDSLSVDLSEHTLDLIVYGGLVCLMPLIKKIVTRIRLNKATLRCNPYYLQSELDSSYKQFIQTNFQNIPPNHQDEPFFSQASIARQKLMPLFFKEFKKKDSENKYNIVLADSGMGKTTFLINLYLRYKLKFFKRYDIYIFPLSYLNIEDDINKIPDEKKCNSIVLLDALDEDSKAVDNYILRINELMRLTHKFRKIIITCRTQFFPFEEAEPSEIEVIKHGPEGGFHRFKKIYLSPFDDSDIKRFLFKKYSYWNISKIYRSYNLVKKCPYLMVRPMLLNYIDDLLKAEGYYDNIYNIYDHLITSWINRETQRKKQDERETFKKGLIEFSEKLSFELYNRFLENSPLHLEGRKVTDFAAKLDLDLSDIEVKSKSLLNRDALGNYKFSHKSVLEFYLGKKAYQDHFFLMKFNFKSFSFAEKIYRDLCRTNIADVKNEKMIVSMSRSRARVQILIPDAKLIQLVAGYRNLYELIISNQKINDDYLCFLTVIRELETLDLSGNLIANDQELQGLNMLRKLNLSNNRLTRFDLSKFSKLEQIDLSNNNIEFMIIDNNNIEVIDMSNNPLTTIKFKKYDNLKRLYLNKVEKIKVPNDVRDRVDIITDNEFRLLLVESEKIILSRMNETIHYEDKKFGLFDRGEVTQNGILFYIDKKHGEMADNLEDRYEFADGYNVSQIKRIFDIVPLIDSNFKNDVLLSLDLISALDKGVSIKLNSSLFQRAIFGLKDGSLSLFIAC